MKKLYIVLALGVVGLVAFFIIRKASPATRGAGPSTPPVKVSKPSKVDEVKGWLGVPGALVDSVGDLKTLFGGGKDTRPLYGPGF